MAHDSGAPPAPPPPPQEMKTSQVMVVVKNPPASAGDVRDSVQSPDQESPREEGNSYPTPLFLPGESHGQKSLTGYSLQGCKELDTTKVT